MQEKTKTLLKTRMVLARKLNNLRYRKVWAKTIVNNLNYQVILKKTLQVVTMKASQLLRRQELSLQGCQMFKMWMELKILIIDHMVKSISSHSRNLEVVVLEMYIWLGTKILASCTPWRLWVKERYWAKTWFDMQKLREMSFRIQNILLLSILISLFKPRLNYSWSLISVQVVI